MKILTAWLMLLMASTSLSAELPELHLYTEDGKPLPGWDLPDFEERWHKSKLLTKEQQALRAPLVLHYHKGEEWVYDTENLTPRKLRKAYRRLNRITTPGAKTLIWVHAVGCAPCNQMKPFMPEVKKLVTVEEIDWDWETPGEFNIQSVPLTVLLDADGNELKRWTGYTTFEEIQANLK